MTDSVRRRNSKWDLKDEPHLLPIETKQDNTWSGKASESIHDKISHSEWNSSKGVGSYDPKWSDNSAVKSKGNSGWTSWEHSPGNRGEQKDENVNRSCSMSLSPSHDGQRQRNRSHSPKNDWSRSRRSRSRSPVYGSRRGLEGWNDRSSGSVVSAPPCKDFAAGRCRRGNQCRFLHQDNHDHEARRHERGRSSGHANYDEQSNYLREKISRDGDLEKHESPRKNRPIGQCNNFLKGRCYRGSSCKYAHHGSSDDGHGTREKAHDRSDTDASFGHGSRREPRRSTKDTPCKYFAAGNCRNGENCRFSHEGATCDSPERRSWDNRRDHNLDSENRPWGGPKWGDKVAESAHGSPEGKPRSDRWGNSLDSENRPWTGSKWGDKAADVIHGSLEGKSLDDKWSHDLDNKSRLLGDPKWSDKGTDSDVAKSSQWKTDMDGWKIGVSVSQSTEKSSNDRWDHNLDDKNRSLGDPKWSDKAVDLDVSKSSQWKNETDGWKTGVHVSQSTEKSSNDRWGHNLDDKNRSLGDPERRDKATNSDVTKSSQWKTDTDGWKIGVHVSQSTEKPSNDGWGHNLDDKNRSLGDPKWRDKATNSDVTKSSQWKTDMDDWKIGVPVSLSTEKSSNDGWGRNLDDVSRTDVHMSPRWRSDKKGANTGVRESRGHGELLDAANMPSVEAKKEEYRCFLDNKETGHNDQESQSMQPTEEGNAVTNSAKSQNVINGSSDVALPMFPLCGQSFDHNVQSIDPQAHSNFDMMNGPSQQIVPPPSRTRRGISFDLNESAQQIVSQPSYLHHQTPSHQNESIEKPDMVDPHITSGTLTTQNIVTSEQVAQLNNISASLAHIFGKVQQLPHLYADLNSSNSSVPIRPNDVGSVSHLVESFVQPNQVTWSQKQYDPISDSIELSKSDFSTQPPSGFSTNPIELNKTANQESLTPLSTSEPNGSNHVKSDILEEKLHQESHDLKRSEDMDAIMVKEQDAVHSEDMDADVDEDGKKNKDDKGMRMFKYALVEYVKEILKPIWKEGRLSKEAHKTVVKKVVDKVTGSVQGAHIPQTKEKIDQYLSHSKPKLTKLVKAYVEKYLKV